MPKAAAQTKIPTSAEMMKKSLDKFAPSFHPTPQVAKKGAGAFSASSQQQKPNSSPATPDLLAQQQPASLHKQITPNELLNKSNDG